MGAELVEGKDLIVKDDIVFMITTAGLQWMLYIVVWMMIL
jgi:uncharacterized circularly permuted ATP-grasp superfamily protein